MKPLVTWKQQNDHLHLAYIGGEYSGLIVQNPQSGVLNPGRWVATWHTQSGDITSFSPIETEAEARLLWIVGYMSG